MQTIVNRFDERLALVVAELPPWLAPIMKGASYIGLPPMVIFIAMVVGAVAWAKGNSRIVYAQLASVVALGGNTIVKHLVHRARPETLYVDNMRIQSYSFPSGHAFGSAAVYGLLAYLAYCYLPQPWNLIAGAGLVLLILLVGISRIYLGAHFPSDVMMGWVLGGLSLLAIVKLIKL